MTRKLADNNMFTTNGVKKRKRWTVVNIEDETVLAVTEKAKQEGYSVATALKILIRKGLK